MDRGWLWSTRIVALASVLLISAPALVLQPVHLPMVWPYWMPYLALLWLLRAKTLGAGQSLNSILLMPQLAASPDG